MNTIIKSTCFFFCIFYFFGLGFSQHTNPIPIVKDSTVLKVIDNKSIRMRAYPTQPTPINKDIKNRQTKPIPSNNQRITTAIDPNIGVNFLANELPANVAPPDNNVAVSDAGYIVTVDNRTIEYYKTDGTNLLAWETLENFFNDITLTQNNFFDPRIIYDPVSDRFIFVVVNGVDVDHNIIALAFSKTDNPVDGWNKDYRIVGNSFEPTFWMDQPRIGISENELFISGAMSSDGVAQGHSTLIQLGLQEGYNNDPLDYVFWTNFSGIPIIAPASFGQDGFYGPGLLMVGTMPSGDNRVYLFQVTGQRNSPSTQILAYTIPCTPYSPGADANQLGNGDLLDVPDCRVQNAFYLNGKVHFVFSGDAGSGWNGIKYKIINVVNLNVTGGEHYWQLVNNFDYCYPSIASFGDDINDESVMICFLRSGLSINPQVCVVNFDDGAWSPSGTKIVKASGGPIDIFPIGTTERWGDYTGIQRMYNSPIKTCWLTGCYAFGVGPNHWNVNNGWNAWCAEIREFPTDIEEQNIASSTVIQEIFPNPSHDKIFIVVKPNFTDNLSFKLRDIKGVEIDGILIYQTSTHVYELNVNNISNGVYFLEVNHDKTTINHEKIIVNN